MHLNLSDSDDVSPKSTMGLYPPLETTGDTDFSKWPIRKGTGLQSLALQKIPAGGGGNVVDGLDTALSVASAGLAASGVRVLTTIIAAPVAVGLQAGEITCGCWELAGDSFVGRLNSFVGSLKPKLGNMT